VREPQGKRGRLRLKSSEILFARSNGCLTVSSGIPADDYSEISALMLFYSRFAGRVTRMTIIGSEGTEVIDSPRVIEAVKKRARNISSSLRSVSLQFTSRSKVPDGYEIYPGFGHHYVSPQKQDSGLAEANIAEPVTMFRPALEPADGSGQSGLSHLMVQVRPDRRNYSVRYASEEYMRAVLDVSFFMRGLLSRVLLGRGKFEELLCYRKVLGGRYMDSVVHGFSERVREAILSHSAFRSVGLSKLYPLYADPYVQEIYVDAVGLSAYVDHASFGRLTTNIRLNLNDIEPLIVNLRRNTGLRLDLKVPSIKGDLVTGFCTSRVSVDAYPLVVGRYALDIRKLRQSPFCLVELINQNFITLEEASLMMSFLFHRMNISIIGEPGSGKTTLLTSLDALTPTWWRKIYLEDCVEIFPESRRRDSRGLHLVVDPFESKVSSRRKSSEIVKLLHRNPSYVILGEVQFSDHFRALFHAMAAGIRVIHTSHASGATDFVRRVTKVYGIAADLLTNLDLIVFLRKEEHELGTLRSVGSMTTVCDVDGSGSPRLISVKGGESAVEQGECGFRVLMDEVERKRNLEVGTVARSYEEVQRILAQLASDDVRDLSAVRARICGALPSLTLGG
jgi:flagellar protein FlaI